MHVAARHIAIKGKRGHGGMPKMIYHRNMMDDRVKRSVTEKVRGSRDEVNVLTMPNRSYSG